MRLILSFLLIVFFAAKTSAQTKYYADKNLKTEVAQNKAAFTSTITNANGIITTEVKELKTGKIIKRTSYKGSEPVGKWLVETKNGIEELDYDFSLAYFKKDFKEYCHENLKEIKPKEFDFAGEENKDTFKNPYKFPEIASGEKGIQQFIKNNMHYAEEASKRKLHGEVWVIYKMNTNGEITDLAINKSVNVMLDKEAIRIFRKLKYTGPETHKGVPQSSCVTLPVYFKL